MGLVIAALSLTFLVVPASALAQRETTPGAEAPAHAADGRAALRGSLAAAMQRTGRASSAHVRDESGRTLFAWKSSTRRILASNVKLFTTAAALDRFGPQTRLETKVLGRGELDTAVWRGDLVLRGDGDPTFGSPGFARRAYGGGANVEGLAAELRKAGIQQVSGRVVGDESLFDSLRGGPASGYRVSGYVGPLSALSYDRGLAPGGRTYQVNPPAFAAARLDEALEQAGVAVSGAPVAGGTSGSARTLATAESPPMVRLAELTNKPSDNFFAETLIKRLGAEAGGQGSTAGGAREAAGFAARLGAPAQLLDGSGLSRANRASPGSVTRFLDRLRERRDTFDAFQGSLAVAGGDGTLRGRMRTGPARGRCRAKTGTLRGVSALSGYCATPGPRTLTFSILMNNVSVAGARRVQDRMVQRIAAYRG